MRRKSVHTVRMVLGLVAVSLSMLGAMRGQDAPNPHAAQSAPVATSHG